MRNLATRAKPDGGALANVVERWVSELDHELRTAGGTDADVSGKSTIVSSRFKSLSVVSTLRTSSPATSKAFRPTTIR